MPNVRGHFVPAIETAGRIKKCLDVVLWGADWDRESLIDLDELEVLREYLRSIRPSFCGIRLLVPATHRGTAAALEQLGLKFVPVEPSGATADTLKVFPEKELADAVQTALACDADLLVIRNAQWLAYAPDLDDLGVLLTDTSFLKHPAEIFARGHDVPWAFAVPVWDMPWNGFYHMTEQRTFSIGLDFLYVANKKGLGSEAQETGRSLIHNRLPNICFTRDRLLFYEMQKMAAQRAKWKRQEFAFEIGYYLNFYYPLLFGGFDHAALLVSQTLQLGIPDRNVGATYQGFLTVLKGKDAKLHTIFTDPEHTEFMKRIGYLRHYASHRGTLAPGKLIEKPDKELSDAELDAIIADSGMDEVLALVPEGEMRESLRQSMRANTRVTQYEKESKIVDGIVPIYIDGQKGFIRPIGDTEWNFKKFLAFVNQVFSELKARL